MSEIFKRHQEIQKQLLEAQKEAPSERALHSVLLVCVSKRQANQRVLELQDACLPHQLVLGENYVQEYRDKKHKLRSHTAHLIGPLQRNKAKDAVALFDLIESVHTEKLAKELQKEALKQEKLLEIFLQINISEDEDKAGFLTTAIPGILESWELNYPNLKLRGFMTITAVYDDPEQARPDFRKMYSEVTGWFHKSPEVFGEKFPEISMGMSADFTIAVEEGASIVRVGSALFGSRD